MAGEHLEARARRVLVGLDESGRSTIVSDADVETRLATPAFTRNVIWGADVVPTPVMAENAMTDAATIPPPPAGYYCDISTFPPDSEWDYEGGYETALAQAGVVGEADADGDAPEREARATPGMHQTDTIDIVTVISGEIWAVVETGETLVRAGDTVVQRGTWHAWRNRSDTPCTVMAVHISVLR
jgi:mannose-6-phosphate isomerase-like protein (cupin superfamily)